MCGTTRICARCSKGSSTEVTGPNRSVQDEQGAAPRRCAAAAHDTERQLHDGGAPFGADALQEVLPVPVGVGLAVVVVGVEVRGLLSGEDRTMLVCSAPDGTRFAHR